jgi:type II secretory pathway component PulJ
MAYEQKPNTGSIFKNERKTTDQHPGGTGSCLIDGVEYFVDAWTNESPKGKYQSLKFKRKDKQPMPAAATKSPKAGDFDDADLPPF